MDREYLTELFGGRQFPDGTFAIDHIEEILEHQKVFMEVVSDIRHSSMMTFPVLTYSLLFQNGKFVDEEFARWCSDHNTLWYDSNFYVGADVTSLSNCCRLISDTSKITAFINSIGGTSLSIGSVKVNDINLRRIAIESNGDEDRFMEILEQRVDTCVKSLHCVRHIIERDAEKGLLPNYTNKLIDLEKQYNTIGITAMYEVMLDFGYIETDEFGNNFYSEKAMAFAKRIMKQINDQKEEYGFKYSLNIENSPSERSNVVLAKKDAELYPDSTKYLLYSNQWISLMDKCTIQEKVRLGAELDKECGGGQISHLNLESGFSTKEQAWEMLNYIASSGVIYFAFNSKISTCESNHAFYGEKCPICGGPVKTKYLRVVGFLTPVSSWIPERRIEYTKRQWFDPKDWVSLKDDLPV